MKLNEKKFKEFLTPQKYIYLKNRVKFVARKIGFPHLEEEILQDFLIQIFKGKKQTLDQSSIETVRSVYKRDSKNLDEIKKNRKDSINLFKYSLLDNNAHVDETESIEETFLKNEFFFKSKKFLKDKIIKNNQIKLSRENYQNIIKYQCFIMYYYLDIDMKDIGDILLVSESRISQMVSEINDSIKTAFKNKRL